MTAKLCALVVLFVTVQLYAGEKPSLYLTGNPHVDFFRSSSVTAFAGDSLPLLQQSEFHNGEKSPWIAGLLSLAVPGAGEWYTDNKVKGVIFFGVEAAAWITAYIYDKKGDHQTDMFQLYADQHYRASQYVMWTLKNFTYTKNTYQGYYSAIFTPGCDSTCGPPYQGMNWNEMNSMEVDVENSSNNTGYSHQMPVYGDQQYYELIGKYPQFFSGWDETPAGWSPSDVTNGYSGFPQQRMYADMRAQANNYYDVAFAAISVAIVNHVVSALDAFLSATSYNKSLHAEMNLRLQPMPYGMIPRSTASIKYTF